MNQGQKVGRALLSRKMPELLFCELVLPPMKILLTVTMTEVSLTWPGPGRENASWGNFSGLIIKQLGLHRLLIIRRNCELIFPPDPVGGTRSNSWRRDRTSAAGSSLEGIGTWYGGSCKSRSNSWRLDILTYWFRPHLGISSDYIIHRKMIARGLGKPIYWFSSVPKTISLMHN